MWDLYNEEMQDFGNIMAAYGLPSSEVDVLRQMIESGAWHTANKEAGVLFDAWADWDRYTDALDRLLEPQGGHFTKELAREMELCLWHTAWYHVNLKYDKPDRVIVDNYKRAQYCGQL